MNRLTLNMHTASCSQRLAVQQSTHRSDCGATARRPTVRIGRTRPPTP